MVKLQCKTIKKQKHLVSFASAFYLLLIYERFKRILGRKF